MRADRHGEATEGGGVTRIVNWWPFAAYIVCIVAANWAVATFGPVPVGFGLVAPAGVYFAGATFTFRNFTQQSLGRRWGFGAIALGALLSYAVTDKTIPGAVLPLAVASGLTFALSETADALVWTKLRERDWWARAMGLGDLAGQVIDSAVFLALAFGSLEFLAGQILGKQWTIWPALLGMWLWKRRAVLPRYTPAELG
jgi:queuosine precursor transporter